MTRVGPDKVALFVRMHRDELIRIWRMARVSACAEVFPGLIDGVVESFLDTCSELLGQGRAPEEVWPAIRGVVRWAPPLVPEELHREWTLLAEVIGAAGDSVHCDAGVREWLGRAADHCRDGITDLVAGDGGQAPAGIVTAFVYSSLAPRRLRSEHGTNA